MALLLCLETYLLFDLDVNGHYLAFIFCSTLVIYTIHRMQGLKRIKLSNLTERYKIIDQIKGLFPWILAAMSAISLWCFLHLSRSIQVTLILPSLISILYVIPFYKNKRLRDFPLIKILAIAFSWAYLALIVPIFDKADYALIVSLFLERFLFFLAITIPFDLRDRDIDLEAGTLTFASIMSKEQLKYLSCVCLIMAFICMLYGSMLCSFDSPLILAIGLAYLTTFWLIFNSFKKVNDFYYTFILDGTIGLRCLLILIAFLILAQY